MTESSTNYDAFITLTKLGSLSGQAAVNLATQITGQLASGNVSGLGALALLGNVNLSNVTQVQGDLVASRIAAGTFAAGVIYAGTVNVDNLVGATISGKDVSGANRIFLGGSTQTSPFHAYMNGGSAYVGATGYISLNSTSGSLNVNPTLGVAIAGNTCYLSSSLFQVSSADLRLGTEFTALTLNCSTLAGSLGSRIILKNVDYNATVNGTPGTIVRFT